MSLDFALGRCRVSLGFSCFALAAFCCLFLGAGSSGVFLLAAACHEAGHVAALGLLGAPPAHVRLTALGCRMVPNRERVLSYRRMALVSLAGPGVNLLCAAGLLLPGWGNHPFAGASLLLGTLHALPIEPLTGAWPSMPCCAPAWGSSGPPGLPQRCRWCSSSPWRCWAFGCCCAPAITSRSWR